MKHCRRCLLPETAETLTFDNEGICNICRQTEVKDSTDWATRKIELLQLANRYRGSGDYDCIVPYSGGKDSSFTAWYVAKELHLKPLLVRFNHGFFRPVIARNTTRLLRHIGNAELLEGCLNWDAQRAIMLESLKRKGDYCLHCHLGCFTFPMQVALKYNVKLILWGEKSSDYTQYYKADEYELVDERRLNRFVNLGYTADDLAVILKLQNRDLAPLIYPEASELRKHEILSTCLGNYIEWHPKKQAEIIRQEYGWEGAYVQGVAPRYWYEKIECETQPIRDYLKFLKRGFGRTAHLVSLDLRRGLISEIEARAMIQQYDGQKPENLPWFLELLGLSENEFNDIARKQVVSPWEFPKC